MEKFSEIFKQLKSIEGCGGRILLEHIIFGKQAYTLDKLHIINDEIKIGVLVRNHEIFIHKSDIKLCKLYDNMFVVSDGLMQITLTFNITNY